MRDRSDNVKMLLDRSTEIGTMDGYPIPDYWWLDNDTMLYFEHVPHPAAAVQFSTNPSLPKDFTPGHFKAFSFTVSTGARSEMEPFNSLIGESIAARTMIANSRGGSESEAVYSLPQCNLSPDRNTLLWHSNRMWHLATLDGSKSSSHAANYSKQYACWISNTEWTQVDTVSGRDDTKIASLTLHDIESGSTRKVAVNEPMDGLLLGATADGALLISGYHRRERRSSYSVDACEYVIGDGSFTKSSYIVTPPSIGCVWHISLSNEGSRLAWVVSDKDIYHIYVSDLRGSQWTNLGRYVKSFPSDRSSPNVHRPMAIRWLPGDEKLSLVMGAKLYLVDIDQDSA